MTGGGDQEIEMTIKRGKSGFSATASLDLSLCIIKSAWYMISSQRIYMQVHRAILPFQVINDRQLWLHLLQFYRYGAAVVQLGLQSRLLLLTNNTPPAYIHPSIYPYTRRHPLGWYDAAGGIMRSEWRRLGNVFPL